MLKFIAKRFLVLLKALVVLCLLTAAAHAHDGTVESWQHQMLTMLLNLVAAIVTLALPLVVAKVLKHFNIQTSAAVNDEIQGIVADAVTYAQHWAATKIDQKLPPTPEQLQNVTMQFILQQITARKLPEQAQTFLENLIKTYLAANPVYAASSSTPQAVIDGQKAMRMAFYNA